MESRGVITLDAVKSYQKKYGTKVTSECLRKLGILQQFYNAYSLPIGRELLDEVNSELIRISHKILTDANSDQDDKAMFRAFVLIAQSWAKKISEYNSTVQSVKETCEDAQ